MYITSYFIYLHISCRPRRAGDFIPAQFKCLRTRRANGVNSSPKSLRPKKNQISV